jgi:hypothetical protein
MRTGRGIGVESLGVGESLSILTVFERVKDIGVLAP